MTNFNYALSALGASATASNTFSTYTAMLTIDGNDNTYWRPQNSGSGYYVTVNLGAPQYIETIQVRQVNGCYAAKLSFQYSNDNVTYTPLLTLVNAAAGENAYATGPLTAQYWRMIADNVVDGFVGVQAIRIIGPVPAPPPPTNPAPDYIHAWLDGIKANYEPTIQTWLDDHH